MLVWKDYRLDQPIANGRYGKIYIAVNTGTNERVIVKKVDLLSIPKDDKKLMENEVEIHRMMKNEYIVRFIDYHLHNAVQYIVLEYCDRGDLMSHIKLISDDFKRFNENTILLWTYQMLQAVEHVHSNNVVHRDVKPDNILMQSQESSADSGTPMCKLADFGLSWRLSSASDKCDTFTGTPIYMAPELVSYERYSFSVDIWSLGCIVYELCTLRNPFYSEHMEKVISAIKFSHIPDIPDCFTTKMKELIKEMMNRNADQRPSAQKLLNSKIFFKFKLARNYPSSAPAGPEARPTISAGPREARLAPKRSPAKPPSAAPPISAYARVLSRRQNQRAPSAFSDPPGQAKPQTRPTPPPVNGTPSSNKSPSLSALSSQKITKTKSLIVRKTVDLKLKKHSTALAQPKESITGAKSRSVVRKLFPAERSSRSKTVSAAKASREKFSFSASKGVRAVPTPSESPSPGKAFSQIRPLKSHYLISTTACLQKSKTQSGTRSLQRFARLQTFKSLVKAPSPGASLHKEELSYLLERPIRTVNTKSLNERNRKSSEKFNNLKYGIF